jgi:hypothetical protein
MTLSVEMSIRGSYTPPWQFQASAAKRGETDVQGARGARQLSRGSLLGLDVYGGTEGELLAARQALVLLSALRRLARQMWTGLSLWRRTSQARIDRAAQPGRPSVRGHRSVATRSPAVIAVTALIATPVSLSRGER